MPPLTTPRPAAQAVIFDAYGTLFDVYSVSRTAEVLFPGQGNALAQLWRLKQIEYTQLRTLCDTTGKHYRPFWEVTLDALRYATARLGIMLDADAQERLMGEYARLSAFDDVLPALQQLRGTGIDLGILSNGSPAMLDSALTSAGMTGLFDHVLSVDTVRLFKTASQAYALGPAAFGAPVEEIVFVSSNGWDICGATWYGYTTFWVNRAGLPPEELGVSPHAEGRGLDELSTFIAQLGHAA